MLTSRDMLGCNLGILLKAQSVTKKNCEEEVRFFGTISWQELKPYQKIALLTERENEQAPFHAQFLALALRRHHLHMILCSLRS